MNKRIAIITARGGSKRVPRKNIREFCGKPIISYAIRAAIESEMFDEVMVSTDDEEIAKVSKLYGAKVPFFRSKENSDDFATTNDVLRETLLEYQLLGQEFDQVTCIYPTAPFITAEKIKKAIVSMDQLEGDALTAVVKYSYPPQRALIIEDGFLKYQNEKFASQRSQELEPIYHDVGQLYIKNSRIILDNLKPSRWIPFIVSELEAQDIDNEEDWKIAEIKFKQLFNIEV